MIPAAAIPATERASSDPAPGAERILGKEGGTIALRAMMDKLVDTHMVDPRSKRLIDRGPKLAMAALP